METELATPIPCKVDGQPAIIVGYGDANAGPAIDYRLVLEDGSYGLAKWLYAGSSRLQVEAIEQQDWHVDYHWRQFKLYGECEFIK